MIKVYLQYPWKIPDSSYYKSIVNYPPEGIEYINVKKEEFEGISSASKFKSMLLIKNTLRSFMDLIKRPNLVKTKADGYDLIHCCHCLSLNKSPWIVDSESYWNLSATSNISNSKQGKSIIKKKLKSVYCKKIIPWTDYAKNKIIATLDDKEIENKIEVIPYAIPLPKIKKINNKDHLTFLFIGRYFYEKGGLTAVKIFDYLVSEFSNVKVIMVSEIPEDVKEKYRSFFNNNKVKIYPLMKQEQLMNEVYPEADVFFYPGYTDSFGFMMVEAMSYGIPVITADGYARRDVIKDHKTGFIIPRDEKFKGIPSEEEERELIKGFLDKTTYLINYPSIIKSMGANALEEVKNGKFCLEKRNKKLKSIYQEAMEK